MDLYFKKTVKEEYEYIVGRIVNACGRRERQLWESELKDFNERLTELSKK